MFAELRSLMDSMDHWQIIALLVIIFGGAVVFAKLFAMFVEPTMTEMDE
jgi:hypothetical protein